MELSKLVKAFRGLLGSDDTDIIDGVRNAIFSESKNEVMAAYVDLVDGDLQNDELQKIFQYYYADRKEKKQDYTPKSIARLCAAATNISSDTVYDVCAGSGALAIHKWVQDPQRTFMCEELDERVIPILLFNLSVRNMSGYVINRDVLTLETKNIYRLDRGERFSTIVKVRETPEIVAGEIVSNPPYNLKWDAPTPMLADKRFPICAIPPAANANFAFVLTALSRLDSTGKCAFVLPCGCLTSAVEKAVRSYLIQSGLIERVILLPDRMFESTSIQTCVIVFSNGNTDIKFFDCSKKAIKEKRIQNGQHGGNSHEKRAYEKIVNVIPDDLITEICGECKAIDDFSGYADAAKIATNDYSLSPSLYIETKVQEKPHRPYAEIIADINRVCRERALIKITCNETLAKELGINGAAKSDEQADIAKQLNATFELLGGHYESRRYLTLTKNKNEFKLENQDKEFLSSIVRILVPMWKQHVFYLNDEENRLLAELRDAMLPELMSGNLEI